jgi:hypothetical protein
MLWLVVGMMLISGIVVPGLPLSPVVLLVLRFMSSAAVVTVVVASATVREEAAEPLNVDGELRRSRGGRERHGTARDRKRRR